MISNPGLGGHLYGIPRRAQWWCVGQVEFGYAVDGHVVKQRGGVGINPLGCLGALGADQLRAEQLAVVGVAGDANVDGVRAGIVRLVIIRAGLAGEWGVAGCHGFMFTKPGAGGDKIEHFDDLGAEAAGESGCAAKGVFAGHSTLFVRRCPERKVDDAEEAVVGDDAVAGRPNVRQAGRHRFVHHHGTPGTDSRTRRKQQISVWADTDHDQHQVDVPAEGLPVWSEAVDVKPAMPLAARLMRVIVERV